MQLRPIVTNRVAWSVCRFVTLVSPAKTAEPIEMPFGLRTLVGPGNHVLDGGADPPREGAIFLGGKGAFQCKVGTLYGLLAEPIEMPFGLWAQMGPRNHVLVLTHPSSWRRRHFLSVRQRSGMTCLLTVVL